MPMKIIGYIPNYEFIYEIETEMEDYENFEEEFLYRPYYSCINISNAWLQTNHPFIVKRYIDITTNEDMNILRISEKEQRERGIYKKNKKYYREQKIFFLSYETAFQYHFYLYKKWKLFPDGYTGIYREFYESGQLKIEFLHNNGEIIGDYKTFGSNGREIKVKREHLFNFG